MKRTIKNITYNTMVFSQNATQYLTLSTFIYLLIWIIYNNIDQQYYSNYLKKDWTSKSIIERETRSRGICMANC